MATISPATLPPPPTTANGTVPSAPWGPLAIDAAAHGAIAFCQIYYEAYDEPTRRAEDVPALYLPTAKIIWNGNTVPGDPAALSEFLKSVPLSRHDLQTLDCHPVASEPNSAPSLIINVTGSVLHGPAVISSNNDKSVPDRDLPRKFHEMFMLKVVDQGEGLQPKYSIHSSNFRFIG
ncbi:hypothetical protein IAT38_007862 [Cryptococcus sp. DSM 104549]